MLTVNLYSQEYLTKKQIIYKFHIKIETEINSKKKTGFGIFYAIDVSVNDTIYSYTIILIKKVLVKNATRMKLFYDVGNFKTNEFTNPIDSTTILDDDKSNLDLVAIFDGKNYWKLDSLGLKTNYLHQINPVSTKYKLIDFDNNIKIIGQKIIERIKIYKQNYKNNLKIK
ncbi:MAG: hypothetical protein H7174_10530 [Flavobacterium sp.]|nr:hypothetical protein [Flavobacterium sp.]